MYVKLSENEAVLGSDSDQDVNRLPRCYWCGFVGSSVSLVGALHYYPVLLATRHSVSVVPPVCMESLTESLECPRGGLSCPFEHTMLDTCLITSDCHSSPMLARQSMILNLAHSPRPRRFAGQVGMYPTSPGFPVSMLPRSPPVIRAFSACSNEVCANSSMLVVFGDQDCVASLSGDIPCCLAPAQS